MTLSCRPLEGLTGHDAAWQLLRELYQAQTGLTRLPPIAYGPRGKPDFTQGRLHFSLSHTPRHAFAALSESVIGIDAEELDRRLPPGLETRVLSPMELEQYRSAPDPHLALLTFWVLKEAQAKCTGEGLRLWPNETNFLLCDPRVRRIDTCLVAVIQREAPAESAVRGEPPRAVPR